MSTKEATPMFACTKCNSRHPFDELSQGQQLCKECRGSYPVVKCTYCRAEFQQENKKNTNTICKKCAQNIKAYGMPKPCEYCSVIAAFIGNKCQRCSNSEKKYGYPHTCQQCKQKCAFDRKDERKRVDGKLLCWLCTLSYKRVLQKAQKRKIDFNSRNRNPTSPSSSPPNSTPPPQGSQEKERTKEKDRRRLGKDDKDVGNNKERGEELRSKSSRNKTPLPTDNTNSKKTKFDVPSVNGDFLNSATSSFGSQRMDHNFSDQVVEITRLREEVEALKKQLEEKERTIIQKDRQITLMKAEQFRMENESRTRVQQVVKQHEVDKADLQERNRELAKQLASLRRDQKTSAPSIKADSLLK